MKIDGVWSARERNVTIQIIQLSMGSDGTIQEAYTLQELIGTSQERLKTVLNKMYRGLII